MPTAPTIPEAMQSAGSPAGMPASPANYLMAAADLHASNSLDPQRSAPMPAGHALQTGKPITKPKHIRIIK